MKNSILKISLFRNISCGQREIARVLAPDSGGFYVCKSTASNYVMKYVPNPLISKGKKHTVEVHLFRNVALSLG